MTDYKHLTNELTTFAELDKEFIDPEDSINTKAAEAIRQLVAERELDEQRVADLMVQVGELSAERDAALERADELSSDKGTYFRMYEMACIHLTNKDEQIAKLTAERDAAFAMSRCECESNEACKNLVALHDEVERLKQERDAALAEVKRLQFQQEQYGPDKLAIQKQAWLEADRARQITEQREQITTLKSALCEAKESVDFYLAANDPSEFGCACDPSVDHLCGPCYADKQQYPLRKAIATINEALK